MTEPTKQEMAVKAADFGPIRGTPLHFIWICDVSDSMRHGKKIEELNMAIEKAIASLKEASKKTPAVQIFMRTIKFSTGAEWLDKDNISLKSYQFKHLESDGGVTDLGEALSKVADALRFKKDGGLMPEVQSKLPHIVLITDGYPTDDWESGLKKLDSTVWGKNAVRMAVALGDAADDDGSMEVLRLFVGNVRDADHRLLQAANPEKLTECLIVLSQLAQNPGENYGGKRWQGQDENNVPPPPKEELKPEPEGSPAAESPAKSDDSKKENITDINEEVHTY